MFIDYQGSQIECNSNGGLNNLSTLFHVHVTQAIGKKSWGFLIIQYLQFIYSLFWGDHMPYITYKVI